MVEENGVNGFSHHVITSEGERDVGDSAADFGVGEIFFDPAGGINEVCLLYTSDAADD